MKGALTTELPSQFVEELSAPKIAVYLETCCTQFQLCDGLDLIPHLIHDDLLLHVRRF